MCFKNQPKHCTQNQLCRWKIFPTLTEATLWHGNMWAAILQQGPNPPAAQYSPPFHARHSWAVQDESKKKHLDVFMMVLLKQDHSAKTLLPSFFGVLIFGIQDTPKLANKPNSVVKIDPFSNILLKFELPQRFGMKIYLKIRNKKRNGLGPWTFPEENSAWKFRNCQVIQSLISSSFAKKFPKDPTPPATSQKKLNSTYVAPLQMFITETGNHENLFWKTLSFSNFESFNFERIQLSVAKIYITRSIQDGCELQILPLVLPSKLSPSRRQNSCEAIRKRVERSLEVKRSNSIRFAVGVVFWNPLSALMVHRELSRMAREKKC